MPRKLKLISFLTLDGVMQAPGGKEEDTEGGFQYGGWQMRFLDDDNPVIEELKKAGALLLGRKTYDIFAGFWPTQGKDVEFFGEVMNRLPKYVASRSLRETTWQNSRLLKEDLKADILSLKSEAGLDIYMFGSGDLALSLMRENLIDELILMIHPLLLGNGKRLFRPEGSKHELELLHSKITKDGVFVATYKVKN